MSTILPASPGPPVTLTVGHSNRSLSDVIALLQAHDVTPLGDVRERLRVLQDQGVPVVIVTHQGGVGYR